jgi:hypothetical protein
MLHGGRWVHRNARCVDGLLPAQSEGRSLWQLWGAVVARTTTTTTTTATAALHRSQHAHDPAHVRRRWLKRWSRARRMRWRW